MMVSFYMLLKQIASDMEVKSRKVLELSEDSTLFRVEFDNGFDIILQSLKKEERGLSFYRQNVMLFDKELTFFCSVYLTLRFTVRDEGADFMLFSIDALTSGSDEHVGELRLTRDGAELWGRQIGTEKSRRLYTKSLMLT